MKKTVNLPLLLLLMVIGGVVGGALYFLHGYQVQRHAGVYLTQADRAEEAGNAQSELDFLNRYVMLNPDNPEVYSRYALRLADSGGGTKSFFTLDQALRKDPDNQEVRRKLVDLAMQMGRWRDALDHLQGLPDHEQNGELIDLQAQCHQMLGDEEQAVALYQQAIQLAPEQMESYLRLAQLQFERTENLVEPDALLDEMVEKNADSYQAWLWRGQWRREHVRDYLPETDGELDQQLSTQQQRRSQVYHQILDDAVAAWNREAKDLEVLLFVSQTIAGMATVEPEQSETHLNQARSYLVEGLKHLPEEPSLYANLASLEQQSGDAEAAIKWYQQGIQAIPQDKDLKWNYAQQLIDLGRHEEATKVLGDLESMKYQQPLVEFLRGRILVVQEQWLKASQHLETVRVQLQEWPDLIKQTDLWLGYCYGKLGNADQQLLAYRRAVSVDSNWVPARLGVASSLVSVGRIDEALEQYELLATGPNPPQLAGIKLAQLYFLSTLQRPAEKQNWAGLKQLTAQVAKQNPDAPEGPLLQAEIAYAQRNIEEAEQILQEARKRLPEAEALWSAIINLTLRRELLTEEKTDWAATRKLLEEARQQLGDCVSLRLAQGRFYLYRNALEKEDQNLRDLEQLWTQREGLEAEQQLELAGGLAGIALGFGEAAYPLAEQLCTFVAEQQPNNLGIRLLLFDLAYRSNDEKLMEEWLEQLEQIEGQGPLWQYGEALRLTVVAQKKTGEEQTADYSEALSHLTKAKAVRSNWSRLWALEGQIHDLQKNTDQALTAYQESVELGERNFQMISRTVGLLFTKRRYREADRVLRKMSEQRTPFSAELVKIATEISLRVDDTDRAFQLAQEASKQSENWEDYIWLGQVLTLLQKPEEAKEKFLMARKLAPTETSPRVALVQFYSLQQDLEQAKALIREMEQDKELKNVNLAMAQCYELIDDFKQAGELYQRALQETPQDTGVMRAVAAFHLQQGHGEEAESLLRKITNQTATTNAGLSDDQLWARRNLALLLSYRKGKENLDEAADLVDQNLEQNRQASDLRTKALILAARPGRQHRQEAIKIFEELTQDQTADSRVSDRFLLAQLYLSEADLSNYHAVMRSLVVTKSPEQAQYLQTYIDTQLKLKNYADAETWIGVLERFQKQEPKASLEQSLVEFRARLLVGRNQDTEAISLITGYVDGLNETNPERLGAVALWAAGKLEGFYQTRHAAKEPSSEEFLQAAEKYQRLYVQHSPKNILSLSAFFARSERPDEALKLLEQHYQQASAQEVAAVFASLAAYGQVTQQTKSAVMSLLQQAIQHHHAALPLVLSLADLQAWEQNYAVAEQIYRQILEKDPRQVIALNNLALIIAFQKGDQKEALRLINRAIEIVGPEAALIDSRGLVYLATNEADAAARDFEQALVDADTPTRQLHLAMALAQQGNQKRARELLTASKERGLSEEKLHPLERAVYLGLKTKF